MTNRGFSNGSSKAALVLLTKSWAAEYGPAGVRVNAVTPGPTRTEGTAGMGEALDQLASAAPSGRPGLPEEIAAAITYLASDAASFVQGAVLPVDGGRIAVRAAGKTRGQMHLHRADNHSVGQAGPMRARPTRRKDDNLAVGQCC